MDRQRRATPATQTSGREETIAGTEEKSHDIPAPTGNRQKTEKSRLVVNSGAHTKNQTYSGIGWGVDLEETTNAIACAKSRHKKDNEPQAQL